MCETNDTWARDHGAITMLDSEALRFLISCSMLGAEIRFG
jgi:agmatine/peptidylarginine deiminase